jgi:hypothetical protein
VAEWPNVPDSKDSASQMSALQAIELKEIFLFLQGKLLAKICKELKILKRCWRC